MQFQVPQFIETEDKIVGPFSMRQFIYMSIAGGFSFILYFTVQPWVFILLSILFFSIAASFAFIRVSGRSLTRVAMSALNFYWKPQTYVWQQENPELGKRPEMLEPTTSSGVSLEDIVAGIALRGVWRSLQTGEKAAISNQQFFGKIQQRYQVFQQLSGDRGAGRRIDYR